MARAGSTAAAAAGAWLWPARAGCLQQAATRLLRPSVLPEARLLFPCRHFVAQDSDTRAAGLGRRGQGPSAEWTGHESGELQRAPARVWMAQQDPHHRYNVKRVARGKEVDFSASSGLRLRARGPLHSGHSSTNAVRNSSGSAPPSLGLVERPWKFAQARSAQPHFSRVRARGGAGCGGQSGWRFC